MMLVKLALLGALAGASARSVAPLARGRAGFVAPRAGARLAPHRALRPRGAGAVVQMDLIGTIEGVAVGVGGLGLGIGLVAWSESQAVRMEERGSDAMSTETRQKMAGMFMEDVEMDAVGVDDTIAKMEAAMAAAKGKDVEEYKAETAAETREKIGDGWDD